MAITPLSTVDFDWTPKSVPLSFTVGGTTYPPTTQVDNISRPTDSRYLSYTTTTNTLLTFVASVIAPSGIIITEYRWDFGDGTIGYGATTGHTYTAASPQTQVTLNVTDNKSRIVSRSRILNLRPAVPIGVGLGARVS